MISALVAAILFSSSPDSIGKSPEELAKTELVAAKQAYLDARKNKSNLEEASFKYGEVVVNSPVLGPKDKYPLALALFRQTLAINPDNSKAKEWENQIESIYASLGKEPTEFDLNTIK
ncbi:MAG: hypothetical protein ACKVQS_07805 [Fimbriimonadaceae bacterium]